MRLGKKQQPVPRRRLHESNGSGTTSLSSYDIRHAFRRNRTMTGSLSSDVASVNEHKAELRSSRVHTHHLRRHRKHAGLALVVVIAVSAGLAYLIYQSIGTVHVSGEAVSHPIDASLYQSKILDYLNRHPTERFRFSLNTAGLASYLETHGAPEVVSVSASPTYDGFGQAGIYLHFRQPVVAWQTDGTRMYVDANGIAFTRNYFSEPSVQVVDQSGIKASDNQVLVSNRFLGFIGLIVGRMATYHYTVTDIILPAGTTRQVDVKCAGVGYPIKFSIDRGVGEQAEDAVRSITYLAQHGITAQYLDVRVSGEAFYM